MYPDSIGYVVYRIDCKNAEAVNAQTCIGTPESLGVTGRDYWEDIVRVDTPYFYLITPIADGGLEGDPFASLFVFISTKGH
jgi:hypothetical protein